MLDIDIYLPIMVLTVRGRYRQVLIAQRWIHMLE